MMDEKQRVRQQLLHQRKQMNKEEVKHKSLIIQKTLQQDTWFQDAKSILFYVSYGNEVSTHQLIKTFLEDHDKTILPRSQTKSCTIDPKIITSWDQLQKGSYGIMEPSVDASSFTGKLDLIIIPGVGFDQKGNRIGHGKGYYDRLIQHHPQAKLIGLAFDFQIIASIPTDPYDKKVHKIITETRSITI